MTSHETENFEEVILNQDKSSYLLGAKLSGQQRRWREFEIPEGRIKYCNWSVFIEIIDKLSQERIDCEQIVVSGCNYDLKRETSVKNSATLRINSKDTRGTWQKISFVLDIYLDGRHVNFGKVGL